MAVPVADLGGFLEVQGLSHLRPVLGNETLRGLADELQVNRATFLQRLKELGVSKTFAKFFSKFGGPFRRPFRPRNLGNLEFLFISRNKVRSIPYALRYLPGDGDQILP